MKRRDSRILLLGLLGLCTPAIRAEVERSEAPPGVPVVGHTEPFDLVPDLRTTVWSEGRGLWFDTIRVEGAFFLKAHIVDLDLRDGDTLTIRAASGKVVEVLAGRGPKAAGTFWGLSGRGDTMTLELSLGSSYATPPFKVDQVLVGDADLMGAAPLPKPLSSRDAGPESICEPPDFEDVICYQNDPVKWANIRASVGVMSVGGNPNFAIFCSGSNISPSNLVLTNEHCLGIMPGQSCFNSAEFVFQFWRTDCNVGALPTEDWESFRCDEVLAQSPFISCDQGPNDLDFTLSSVMGDPAATFGWVEPDPVPLTDGEAIYIVQHPQGRPHEITHGSGANVDVDGTVLRYYDTLDTEGGSSGSPIFREADGKLIGLHHCGGCSTPGVGNRGMLMSDIYPLIEEHLGGIFTDGFESGDLSAWDETAGGTEALPKDR